MGGRRHIKAGANSQVKVAFRRGRKSQGSAMKPGEETGEIVRDLRTRLGAVQVISINGSTPKSPKRLTLKTSPKAVVSLPKRSDIVSSPKPLSKTTNSSKESTKVKSSKSAFMRKSLKPAFVRKSPKRLAMSMSPKRPETPSLMMRKRLDDVQSPKRKLPNLAPKLTNGIVSPKRATSPLQQKFPTSPATPKRAGSLASTKHLSSPELPKDSETVSGSALGRGPLELCRLETDGNFGTALVCSICEMADRSKHQVHVRCINCGAVAHGFCLGLSREEAISYRWMCANCNKCVICGQLEGNKMMVKCEHCEISAHRDCAPNGVCGTCAKFPKRDENRKGGPRSTNKIAGSSNGDSQNDSAAPMMNGISEKSPIRNTSSRSSPKEGPKKSRSVKSGARSDKLQSENVLNELPIHTRVVPRSKLKVARSRKHANNLKSHDRRSDILKSDRQCDQNGGDQSLVTDLDRELFEEARTKAANILKKSGVFYRSLETKSAQREAAVSEYYQAPKIGQIRIGPWLIEALHRSPYPMCYDGLDTLYICEFCLQYLPSPYVFSRHEVKCPHQFPLGNEIYRSSKGDLSVFEVDGNKSKCYCQNLCLLSKLFLDHKTLYYDVEPFLFYVLTKNDEHGMHIVGYFSKEKNSFLSHNLSCFMVLPPYQSKGYGRFLVDFSYLLTRSECKTGTPERPFSDLGLLTYRSYWIREISKFVRDTYSTEGSGFCIKVISNCTGIMPADIVDTLQQYGALKKYHDKHIIVGIDRFLSGDLQYKEPKIPLEPSRLIWTPAVFKN